MWGRNARENKLQGARCELRIKFRVASCRFRVKKQNTRYKKRLQVSCYGLLVANTVMSNE
jgi:hypothetical protein